MQNITTQNFEADLVDASLAQPVLLDIWAEWCGPCKALGPVLEKIEADYAGRFKLGKLDADAEPEIAGQLSQMFGVRSIPFCVLFKGGQPVDGFVGALPDAEVRKFLDKHLPSAEEQSAAADVSEAEALMAEGDSDAALEKLAAAVAADPGNDTARYDYLRALLDDGRLDDAETAWDAVASNVILDPRLAAAGQWLAAARAAPGLRPLATLKAVLAENKRDFDTRFELAQHHFSQKEFTRAMDELLEILMRDKTWNGDAARKCYVAILEIMTRPTDPKQKSAEGKSGTLELSGKMKAVPPADPLIDTYRRRLSSTLF